LFKNIKQINPSKNSSMKTKSFFVLLLVSLLTTTYGYSQAISQWKGADRNGIYNENNLLQSWPEGGPSMLWAVENIGDGYGSPVVANDIVYVNGEIDTISHVFAFDRTGKLLWKTPNGREFSSQASYGYFPGARSTPTVVGDLVYTNSGYGRIACLDAKTGSEKWAVHMVKDLKGIMPEYGYAESLLIDGDILYCFPGGKESNAAALNRLTGKVIWTSKAKSDTVAYCSPLLINLPSRKVVVNLTSHYLVGVDASNGELLWSQKQDSVKYSEQCNIPVYSDGNIYYIAADGNGLVKLQLSADGKSIKELWRNADVRNYQNGLIKINNYLYCPDEKQKLKCVDANTGTVVDSIRVTKGGMFAAQDMLFMYSNNGTINMIKYNGSKMEIAGKFKCEKGTKEHLAHPVVARGDLYIRHGKALVAYKIAKI
jgi:outer membrane protein assembly factor BamB